MDWIDEGIVLAARPHGESSAIVTLLTRQRGRHAGLVQGGLSSRQRPLFQPGNLLRAEWRARLSEHLGHFRVEMNVPYGAQVLDDGPSLAGLLSACTLLDTALPEREPHPAMFDGFTAFLSALGQDGWPLLYVHLELGLLQELGYGLDLARCALTGAVDDLAFVSPKSGRAVAREAAEPWREKLLALPSFLAPGGTRGDASPDDVVRGLALTEHFLERHVYWPHNRPLPAARARLMEILQRNAATDGDP
jgi:DNA repair protein RecO (recombination protein O)